MGLQKDFAMSGSPPTLGTDPKLHSAIGWNDPASLHRRDDGGGLLFELKAMRRGTLAELVRFVRTLPEAERKHYVIEKAGDHRLDHAEIRWLAERPDFPG
jgi:hypothetical protein